MVQKQPLTFNFGQGLDLKSDPKQIPAGRFLSLINTTFNKGGLLQKRNGFGALTLLPNSDSTYLTTFNGNLTSVSTSILALSQSTNTWVSKGTIQPLSLSTLPLIRSNTNQSQADIAISSNGLICTVFTDQDTSNTSTLVYKYAIADATTGQNIVSPTVIPISSGTVTGSPRVFVLGTYFIIIFTNHVSAYHLQYIAISTNNPTSVTVATDITNSYIPASTVAWDAVVYSNSLYVAYNTTSGGQSVKVNRLSNSLILTAPVTFAGQIATMMSMTVDSSTPSIPVIYASYYDTVSDTGFTLAINAQLQTILAPTATITTDEVLNITSVATGGVCTFYTEIDNAYSYDGGIKTNYVKKNTVTVTGTVGSPVVSVRSLGLASKACMVNGTQYYLGVYDSPFQPTYFLVNGSISLDSSPQIICKLAYENGGGYLATGLPNAIVNQSSISFPYLFKDLIESLSVNGNSQQTTSGGIYAQTGINYATVTINNTIDTVETASSLNIGGGFHWMYDGYLPVEQNFFLWPDSVELDDDSTGGLLVDQTYFYQVVYEWSDNQGNIHRSAPSIPVSIVVSDGTSTTSIIVSFPTLRLTYKVSNPVKAVIYRWSTAQPVYYQVTSIIMPTLNDTTIDSIDYTDTLADASILGNNIIYTTGGVVEDVNAPATNIMTLWNSRLFLVDAEDPNLLWFSKQVIPNTPVEMSDLFTIFIAPTLGASGSTGPITAMGAMDSNLIIFKKDAINYITGTGPDNTGANNLFSEPVFVTSVVGCTNQHSIVNTPQGMMFQSDKGIWMLERSLATNYIGAPVESLTQNATVVAADLIPGTNQVRFVLDSGIMVVYDYYYAQWTSFSGIPSISGCIYNGLHTVLTKYGQVSQETPGLYLDNSNPTLVSFTTGWLNLSGILGYQRIFEFAFLGSYISPHFLNIEIAYDFGAPSQQVTIAPNNFTGDYGSDEVYGQTSPYGGPSNLEEWRVHTSRQKCQAFQITLNEVYNPQFGNKFGAGLTLSGIECVIGVKSSYRPYKGSNTVG